MTIIRNDNNTDAAIPAPRDLSYDIAMTHRSPRTASLVPIASNPSTSAYPQERRRTLDSFEPGSLKEQPLHNSMDRSAEHSTPFPQPMDWRPDDEPYQYYEPEEMSNPAVAHPRNSEQQGEDYPAQLDTRPRAREQQSEDIPSRAEVDRDEKERELNNPQIQYETSGATEDRRSRDLQEQLQTKDQELRDLQAELAQKDQGVEDIRQQLKETAQTMDQELRDLQAELAQKGQEADSLRQKWKGTARELGKFQARGKVIDQVPDSELIQEATKIQYNVRNFTYQHFGDDLNTLRLDLGTRQNMQKSLDISHEFLLDCVRSSVKRPMLVGAFLWAFLMNDVFEKFWWAGERVHHGMEDLMKELKSK